MTFDEMDDHMAAGLMSHVFSFVDERMAILNDLIAKDIKQDGDSNFFYDAEYLTGIGFVAGQHYITSTCGVLKVNNKRAAILLGPKLSNGTTYTLVVNAAANYWKHSDEWNFDKLAEQQEKTRKDLESVGTTVSEGYMIYGALDDLGLKTFSDLTPILGQWSTAVMKWKSGATLS